MLHILQNTTYSAPVKELYVHYNTLPVTQLHKLQLLLLVHKCYYHKHLLSKIYYDSQIKVCIVMKPGIKLIFIYTALAQFLDRDVLSLKTLFLWNDLPGHIKNIRFINKFKSKLKLYLKQNYMYTGITV